MTMTKKEAGASDEACKKLKIQQLSELLDYQTILQHGQLSLVGMLGTI